MSDKPLVSIVVPTYNTADFLEQCLDSLKSQTLENIEIICVNDGSTDNSLEIMQKFAEEDPRFRIIDKPNGGYGHSCNKGLDAANGEYVCIVEPDDFVDPRMYEELYAASLLKNGKHADIVKSSYWLYYDEGEMMYEHIGAPNLMNCMPSYKYVIDFNRETEVLMHHPSIWSAIYKRDFIEKNHIRFIEPKGAGWADNPFFFETMLQAKSVVWIPGAFYYYRQTNPNASSNLKDQYLPLLRLNDIYDVYDKLDITNTEALICLYNRTFNYVRDSLKCSGYDEHDEKLMGMIESIFKRMDHQTLFDAPGKRINRDWRLYYNEIIDRDFVSAKTKAHRAVENPLFSIVLYTYNDRTLAKKTLNSLLKQNFDNFEVICVDCSSKDFTLEMFTQYSKIDKRIIVVESKSVSMAQGRVAGLEKARGKYTCFMNAGSYMPDDYLMNIAKALEMFDDPDIIKCLVSHPLLAYNPETKEIESALVDVASNESALFLMAKTTASAAFFKTSFAKEEKIARDDYADPMGNIIMIRALAHAKKLLAVKTKPISIDPAPIQYKPLDFSEELALRFDHIDHVREATAAQNSPEFQRIYYAHSLESMVTTVRESEKEDGAAAYYEKIRSMLFDDMKIQDLSPSLLIDARKYNWLMEVMGYSYQNYLQRAVQKSRKRNTRKLLSEKLAPQNPIRKVAAKAAKKILPTSAVKSIQKVVRKRKFS